MPDQATYTPRTRRWEAVLLAFSLILGLTVAAATPASALVDDGTLDINFGTNGYLDLVLDTHVNADIQAIAVDSLDRIVVAGIDRVPLSSNCRPFVARVTSAGVIDTDFSIDGFDIFGTEQTCQGYYDYMRKDVSVVVDSNDSVYVVWRKYVGVNDTDFAVRKYLANGNLDMAWGSSGEVFTDIGGVDRPYAAAIIGSNGLVVAGSTGTLEGTETDSVVVRYDAAGVIDSNFGNSGIVTMRPVYSNVPDNGVSRFDDVEVGTDGANPLIYLSGFHMMNQNEYVVVRLDQVGSPDSSFATDGIWQSFADGLTVYDLPDNVLFTEIALTNSTSATSKVILGVSGITLLGNTPEHDLVRINEVGSTDTTFGTDSVFRQSAIDSGIGSLDVTVGGLYADANNIVYTAGLFRSSYTGMETFRLSGGSLDTSFSTSGTAGIDTIYTDFGTLGGHGSIGLSIDSLGRYVVATRRHGSGAGGRIYVYNGTHETVTVPDSVSGLVATAGNGQVGLAWSDPSDGGDPITDYTIEYQAAGDVGWTPFVHATAVTASPTTVDGLTNGTVYTFRITASNSTGNANAASNTDTATPVAPSPPPPSPAPAPAASVPDAPSGVSGSAGNAQVVVSWSAPSATGGSGITGYTVTASPGTATCVSRTVSCTVSGLRNGTPYTFSVHATNSVGDSAESVSSGSVTPAVPAPGLAGCKTGPTSFTDIGGSFAEADIACVNQLRIVNGVTVKTYDPSSVVTREQAAAMLARTWRSMGRTCPTGQSEFTDIGRSFAGADIECMWGLDIVYGVTNTIFDPGAPVTRQEMAAMLARTWRALGHDLQPGSMVFTDIGGSFARNDIESLRVFGITRGDASSTKFEPGGVVTREQMAAFLARAIRVFAA